MMIQMKPKTLFFSLLIYSSVLCAQQKDSVRNKNHFLAVPLISKSIETDWSFGAGGTYTFYTTRKKDSTTRTSAINFLGSYSLRRQFIFLVRGPVFFPREKYILNTNFSYSYFPDRFWGLGNTTPSTQEEEYDFRQYYIYLHAQRLLTKKVFVGISYEFQRVIDVNVKPGGLFDQQNVKGRTPYQVSGIGASISWDKRNSTFWPNKGHLLSLSATHFSSWILSDHRYTNIVADARLYRRISRKQILALQAYGFFNTSTDVPIRSLASLGGADRMRGFFNGRYRDNDLLSFQAEYRVHLFNRFSAVAFTGVGDVNGKYSRVTWSHLKYSFGAGLRFSTSRTEKQHIRIDYGFGNGKGNSGLYVQFGEAF
jgi:outer membrane protein assembly factor BamA